MRRTRRIGAPDGTATHVNIASPAGIGVTEGTRTPDLQGHNLTL